MRLFYGVSIGIARTAYWQWGLHFQQIVTVPADPVNAWQVFCNVFYADPAGGANPYFNAMRDGQIEIEEKLYELDPTTGRKQSVTSFNGNGGGVAGGLTMPPGVTPVAVLRRLDGVSLPVGRIYLPPCSTVINNGGAVGSVNAVQIVGQLQKAAGVLLAKGYQVVIWSHKQQLAFPASFAYVQTNWGYLRSRRLLRGTAITGA